MLMPWQFFTPIMSIDLNKFCWLETGAGAEKDNIWRPAQEAVWNARRLWMGR